jgi:hypothetical protein
MAALVKGGATGVQIPPSAVVSTIYPDVPDIATQTPPAAMQLTGLLAGEAIGAGDACRINSSGLIVRSVQSAVDLLAATNVIIGFAAATVRAGDCVTLYHDIDINYSPDVIPGQRYYLSSAVPGGLDTAPAIEGQAACAVGEDQGCLAIKRVF